MMPKNRSTKTVGYCKGLWSSGCLKNFNKKKRRKILRLYVFLGMMFF
jgi:hypothetical protein